MRYKIKIQPYPANKYVSWVENRSLLCRRSAYSELYGVCFIYANKMETWQYITTSSFKICFKKRGEFCNICSIVINIRLRYFKIIVRGWK